MGSGALIVVGALAVLGQPAASGEPLALGRPAMLGQPAALGEPVGAAVRKVPSAVTVAGCLANWDADPEDDGIRALVALSDRDGRPVALPAGAQATFSLRPVPTREGFTIERSRSDPAFSAPPIRWTVRLGGGESPQTVNLPWRTPSPATVRARLEVRLSVPSRGVFEGRTIVRLDAADIP